LRQEDIALVDLIFKRGGIFYSQRGPGGRKITSG